MGTSRDYQAVIPFVVSGIPCLIGVEHYLSVPRWRWSVMSCPSDMDWYGYTEADWSVLDRKGYPADWLSRKLTDEDRTKAEIAIAKYFGDLADQARIDQWCDI